MLEAGPECAALALVDLVMDDFAYERRDLLIEDIAGAVGTLIIDHDDLFVGDG